MSIDTNIALMTRSSSCCLLLGSLAFVAIPLGFAQTRPVLNTAASAVPVQIQADPRDVSGWLLRMHEASRRMAYTGTLVVSTDGHMASSRIWHVCDGEQQVEHVESLTGAPRSTFRRNEQVITFSPLRKVAVTEEREALRMFPDFIRSADATIEQFYAARQIGAARVAGFQADVVQIEPLDKLRFAYRVWSEQKTGLVIKLQTLDATGKVLDQMAFSDLQLDAPVSMKKLSRMMERTEGYMVQKQVPLKTSAAAEGWLLKTEVPGFRPMSCYRRPAGNDAAGAQRGTVQWIFSDGLASVSMFIDVYDRRHHTREGLMAMGATHTLTQRQSDKTGEWWLTVVGEVPAQTLKLFAKGLERSK
jgi:sigma-E factor negative regulatory protein RseB